MSNCFRWLHLTDFHWGSPENKDFWGQVAPAFYDDLKLLKNNCGGDWDVIFFTGDLVNHGKKEEYEELNEILKAIKKELECDPVFICVPGNHDLTRPDSNASECYAMKDSWFKAKNDLREKFWNKKNADDYHNKIKSYFSNYTTWLETQTHGFRKPETKTFKPGLMPGDFSYTYEKPGTDIKIGIVGLNSTFLQITEGDYNKKLDLSIKQLNEVCTTMPNDWVNKHDMSILLTHQPREWFHAKSDFSAIAPPNRIDLHLCGHLHLNQSSSAKKGGSKHSVNVVQARALFSKEKIKKYGRNGASDQERLHGYCAGKAEFKENCFEMRFWPRIGEMNEDSGVFSFKRDNTQDLRESDGGTAPYDIEYKNKKVALQKKAESNDTDETTTRVSSPMPDEQNEVTKLITKNLKVLLSPDKMKSFCGVLFDVLKLPESNQTPDVAISFLIKNLKTEQAIAKITQTVIHYIDHLSDSMGKINREQTWKKICDIVGWIILSAVKPQEINKYRDVFEKGVDLEFFIPVSKESSVEILFSAIKSVKAGFQLVTNKTSDGIAYQSVCGSQKFTVNTNIEYGLHEVKNMKNFLDQLWKQILGEYEQPPSEYLDVHYDKFNKRLQTLSNREKYIYLLFDGKQLNKNHDHYKAIAELKARLSQLKILVMELNDKDCVVIPHENELEDALLDFLQQKSKFVVEE